MHPRATREQLWLARFSPLRAIARVHANEGEIASESRGESLRTDESRSRSREARLVSREANFHFQACTAS